MKTPKLIKNKKNECNGFHVKLFTLIVGTDRYDVINMCATYCFSINFVDLIIVIAIIII